MLSPPSLSPRQIAGKVNRSKRKALSPEALQKLREAAFRNRPWKWSTGPRTAQGKAKAAANGKARQKGPVSVRELRDAVAEVRGMVENISSLRLAAARVVAQRAESSLHRDQD